MFTPMKEIVNKIIKSGNITHRNLGATKQEVEEIRQYLPTVGYKLLTTYFYSIQERNKTVKARDTIYNYENGINTKKHRTTKFREKQKGKTRIYSIIKL